MLLLCYLRYSKKWKGGRFWDTVYVCLTRTVHSNGLVGRYNIFSRFLCNSAHHQIRGFSGYERRFSSDVLQHGVMIQGDHSSACCGLRLSAPRLLIAAIAPLKRREVKPRPLAIASRHGAYLWSQWCLDMGVSGGGGGARQREVRWGRIIYFVDF